MLVRPLRRACAGRSVGLVAFGLSTLVACGDAGVETISADRPTTTTVEPPPTSAEPPPTPGTEPVESAETDQADDPGGVGEASAGDELFPALGNADLDVTSYVVRLTYDADAETIDGHVTIEATAVEALDDLVLDAGAMEIEQVTVDGTETAFTKTAEELQVHSATSAGASVSIDVEYTDRPERSSTSGLDGGFIATPRGSYVLNEPDMLHSWMPADDHPGDKATWRFEITVGAGLTGVANGTLVEQIEGPDTTTFVWDQSEPMSTYLVLLLTGPYSIIDGGRAGSTGEVPLIHVALTDEADAMQVYFDRTAPQLAFFEQHFGPYPLAHYGLAITDSHGGLAMETQGRSLFSRQDFPAAPTSGFLQELLLSHELAHQWFGNAVSPGDWSSLWLNESFATYAQWMWFDHEGMAELEQTAHDVLQARQYGAESTGQPSEDNLFGFERYDGGAVVLHALRRELGDDMFFELLRQWVARHEGTSRSTADFIDVAEDVAGRSLAVFFEEWLYAVSLPAEFPS